MVLFNFEEIVKRLEISPKELRKIADRLERELSKIKTMSEAERIQEEYYQKFINQKNGKNQNHIQTG